jgi:hypothetical protein
MHSFRRADCAVEGWTGKACRRIRNHESRETEISGHPSSGGYAVIRGETNEDERVNAVVTQILFKIRSNETAVHMLAVDGLGRLRRRRGLNRVSGRLRSKQTIGFDRVVNDVPNRPAAVSPCCEQPGNVRFSIRIVAFTPARVKERLLNIDDNQRCGLRQLRHLNAFAAVFLPNLPSRTSQSDSGASHPMQNFGID